MNKLIILVSLTQISVYAQIPWPDKPKNVQVLPKDISKADLRTTMFGFSNALGANCEHCHVNTNRNDWSTYDFSSDAKETKRIARIMIKMVETINQEELSKIGRKQTVAVACLTCHRGYFKPQLLEDVLYEEYIANDIRAAIRKHDDLKKRRASAFNFGEESLNVLGYRLLGAKKVEDALAVFQLNAKEHPSSSNVFDSLGEAYLAAADTLRAKIFYVKSLELNPDNENAINVLKSLGPD